MELDFWNVDIFNWELQTDAFLTLAAFLTTSQEKQDNNKTIIPTMTILALQGRAINQTSSFGKPLAQRISGSCVFLHLLLISDAKRQKKRDSCRCSFQMHKRADSYHIDVSFYSYYIHN